jgi:5'-3' exonuclease
MNVEELFADKNPKSAKSKKQKNNIMLIDFSGLLHSSFHSSNVRFDKSLENNSQKYQMWRYILLKQILSVKEKFKPDEIVLAIDDSSWRKKEFKYYKANRVLAREKQTDFDAEEFYQVADQFISELSQAFPYKVIKVKGAEGDDVIGVLASHLGKQNINCTIVSRDKDFKQLLKYSSVKFYDPIDKKIKEENDPIGFLLEHIAIGDSSDGIPNILSDDNTFVDSSKRQKRMTKKVKEEINDLGIEQYCIKHGIIDNYERNKKLIDLSETPDNIAQEILYEYNTQEPKSNFMEMAAFMKRHNIKSLNDKINSFLF